jgi:hypothetical protein
VEVCEDGTFTATVTGANTDAPYILTYLFECGGTILASNSTGSFDVGALGTPVGNTCNVYGVNYDPNQPNDLTTVPPTGDCLEFVIQPVCVLATPDLTVMAAISNECPATTADLTTAVTDADGGTVTYFEADGTTPITDPSAVGAGDYVITSTITTGTTDCSDSEVVSVSIVNCDCLDACANGSVTATVTGANTTAPYVLEYVLVCGGNVTGSSTDGTFNLNALGVSPGDDCSIFAANYDGNDATVDLTVFPFVGDCLETVEQPLCVQGFNTISATTECGPDDPDQTGVITIMIDAVIEDPSSVFCVYQNNTLVTSTTFGAVATGVSNMYQVMVTQTGLDGSDLTFGLTFAEPGAACSPTSDAAECTTDQVISPDCPLPAEVVAFNGTVKGEVNVLNWQTASELNTAWHSVERSADGKSDWEEVGRVAAAGYSLSMLSYTLDDEKPLPLAYYRLKVVDIDGSEDYPTDVIAIKRAVKEDAVAIFPNPTSGLVNISYEATQAKNAMISVTDVFGSVLIRETVEWQAGLNNHQLNLDRLARGIYFVQVNSTDTTSTLYRIVKQ